MRIFVADASGVMHQLTDLPDDLERLVVYMRRNNRIRTEGTRNLIGAARAAGAGRFVAQSIAFKPPGVGKAAAQHQQIVLELGGVVPSGVVVVAENGS